MKKVAYITGASSGFGEAAARKFAANGWDVVIAGRRKERLDKLSDELKGLGANVLVQSFDIRNLDEVQKAVESLQNQWSAPDLLINNAGLAAGRGPIQEGVYDDWEQMIDTNVKGLLYITRELVPAMIKKGSGHIINIASLAGHEAYGGGNVYCGTKHAVRAISRSMRIDLIHQGIKVSVVSPGAAETEFSLVRYKWNKEQADKTYEGYQPLSAEDVAESIFFIASQPQHVNIEEIFLLPTAQATANIFHREEKN